VSNLLNRFHNYANSFDYPSERGHLEPQMASGMLMTFRMVKPLQTDRDRRLSWLNTHLGQLDFKPEVCEKICDWLDENFALEQNEIETQELKP
jgi:hypothetical protein